jgi:hypothetical protein
VDWGGAIVGFGFAFVTAIGIATRRKDMSVMGHAVEQSGRQLLVTEDFDPFREGEIAGDDGRAAFVTRRQQIEQQLAARPLERHQAEFIND